MTTTQYRVFEPDDTDAAIALVKAVFSASEGTDEGQQIATLVADLIHTTKADDLAGYIATTGSAMVGCIFFSRLTITNEASAFILSPVAIATNSQGQGIGQQLINFGLAQLTHAGVRLAFTYGDPNYYSKTGFRQITEATVQAPQPLSQPVGWLAQALDNKPLTITGASACVSALNHPHYW